MGWPDELPGLRDFAWVALHWDEFKTEARRLNREAERLKAEAEERRRREEAERVEREALVGLTRQMQAYELSNHLPRDLKQLAALVSDEKLPVDARGKILEVMLYRGATNDCSYDHMGESHWDTDNPWEHMARRDEFAERRRYQEAVRDAVFETRRSSISSRRARIRCPRAVPPARSS